MASSNCSQYMGSWCSSQSAIAPLLARMHNRLVVTCMCNAILGRQLLLACNACVFGALTISGSVFLQHYYTNQLTLTLSERGAVRPQSEHTLPVRLMPHMLVLHAWMRH